MSIAARAVAIAATAAAIVAASLHANPAVLGALGALAFGAIAVAAGAQAVALRAPDDLTEPRVAHGAAAPASRRERIGRARAIDRLWWWTAGAVAVLGAVPFVALRRSVAAPKTGWFPGARLVTPQGRALRPGDLDVGGVTTVFPNGSTASPDAATLLIRVEDGAIMLPAARADWVPGGNVAFSKICTHAGCPVAIYRRATYELYCPCHQSVFNVLFGARPTSGPATRALPQLPLAVDGEGYLVARADYAEPVGPDDWFRRV